MNLETMKTNIIEDGATTGPFIGPAADAVATVEPEDLSRFKRGGGREAPTPDLADVPLDNTIWRRPSWAAHQAHQKKMIL